MQVNPEYMRRALELAARGRGNTSPNPMVGAVIVSPDGRIIGEGYHRRCGEAHAEVNAIASVGDRMLLHDCTMYVTLEPCSHYGKTPPCAQLIIDTGIPRVVIAAADPFREVAGRGVAMLRAAGVEVVEGVMSEQSRSLNARFMTAHELQRPFITLKWARSADGFTDSDRPDGQPARLSTPITSMLVHRLRACNDAILVGSGTILADSPRLDCRLWPGRSPRPVILDRRGRINPDALKMPVTPLIINDCVPLGEIMHTLYLQNLTSILVEGGPTLLQSFIDAGLWDLARVETSPVSLGRHGRSPSPRLAATPALSREIDGNRLDFYTKNPLICVKNL
ncbi:MAG: bifunctional diaminohydroxyphosphoribosylaminopyrimidine deaminase/5-amino-6-(5-phosphoribosylamino)uracil reductase RibD [Bacteroidales bacterium]|nr:bifunctional diaminohydroxyphosphoribosylaminopyrimidine deaminase/5-amino-6-(5-phosphoribosylamino)uracil reductase RibD [Bacteroidales bacterium]